MYTANGRYVASLNSTPTFTAQALDLPEGEVVSSIAWENNRIYVASNRPNLTGTSETQGSIYLWDTYSTSWEYQINIPGRIGALFAKNGMIYLWYQDISSTGGYKLAYVNGNTIQDVEFYTGSLPLYYQVGDDKNHLIWVSGNEIWYWGAISNSLPVKLSQRADAGFHTNTTTTGGITNAFGTPMVASYWDTDTDEYKLAKFSGYDNTVCNWSSIYFQLANSINKARVTRVVIYTEPLATGAKMDTTLYYDYGKSNVALSQIAYSASANTTKHIVYRDGVEVENFNLKLDWANGSATNPVKVRSIHIIGEYLDDN